MKADVTHLIDHTGRKSAGTVNRRFGILYTLLVIGMGVILFRGAYLQIVLGSDFREKAEKNRVDAVTLLAPRGIIYDKNHVQLTENVSSTDLVFDPRTLPKQEHEAYLLDRLMELLPEVSTEKIQTALDRARTTQKESLIVKAIDHETVLRIEQASNDIPGAKLVSSLVRKYPFREALVHVLGYTNSVTADEMESDPSLIAIDTTGKQGIEKKYDAALRGQHGVAYTEVTASGKETTNLGEKPSSPGQDITLTIDVTLQKFIYGLFSERNAKAKEGQDDPVQGSAIVLNPKTGDVLALVNFPSFDPNVFSQPALRQHTEDIFTDPLQPLFNRAVDGTYPSGSTIKPFLAAAALEENIITETTTVYSTGAVNIGPWRFADWKAGGHGITDVKKALAESVNTFFYMIAGGIDASQGLGVDRATSYLKEFGWASKTGIDLPSEAPGFLPSPEWKLRTTGQPWYIGDTYHLGIGQGNVLVTPLQIAVGTAGIANKDAWYEPHFVEGPAKKHELPVSEHNIRIVQEGMRQAVVTGSAASLQTLPIPIAGKTGTAQIGGSNKTHAWFTSFGPYDDPELVVTVLLERGGAGDVDAVPLAKEIWQWISEQAVKTP